MEEWRAIPGCSPYEASTDGRIRRGLRVLSPGNNKYTGYLGISLYVDGRIVQTGVHRFVAMAFFGPCPEGHEVHHIDENKHNNAPANLSYVTRQQNLAASGRVGDTHERALLTSQDVHAIRDKYIPRKYGRKKLAKEYGVSHRLIDCVIDRHGRFA